MEGRRHEPGLRTPEAASVGWHGGRVPCHGAVSEDGLDTGPANTAPHPSFIANKFLSGNHQFWGK